MMKRKHLWQQQPMWNAQPYYVQPTQHTELDRQWLEAIAFDDYLEDRPYAEKRYAESIPVKQHGYGWGMQTGRLF
jgi:hypothetical protein